MSRSRNTSPDWRAPSNVLLAARLATGAGTHGKRGKGRSKTDSRSRSQVRANLRREDH